MNEQGGRGGRVADLDTLPPGPELVAALEALGPDTLTGDDLAAYVRACARVNNRGTARLLAGMHHLGRAQAGRTDRRAILDEFSGDEVAVALGWSRSMAARKLDLADDLTERLPAVGHELGPWHRTPRLRWTLSAREDVVRACSSPAGVPASRC